MSKPSAVCGFLVLVLAVQAQAQGRSMQKTLIQGDTMYTLMAPGGIPAIFNPKFKPASDLVLP